MAYIVGGIACSHTPTIGYAHDRHGPDDPVWGPIFHAFEPVKGWLRDCQPDVAIVIYNDHVTSFFFDHYSPFVLGVGASWAVADEGGGVRRLPAIAGHPALAAHIGESLAAEEFDLSFFQGKPLDHGCFSPLSMLCDHADGWPFPIIPLQVGVLQAPSPTARRCWRLGQALRRAVESYPADLRIVIVATGGLSHQVHGERAGFNNPDWDARFLDLIERDPERLTQMTLAELATLGGFESAEVVMWLVMRGALSAHVTARHRAYELPSMTGIATVVFENLADAPEPSQVARQRARIAREFEGIEKLPGTYPVTLLRNVNAFAISTFLHSLIEPAIRARFLADEDAVLREAELTEVERGLIRRRDWQGMVRHGVIFFLLEKLAAVVGLSNLHVYAAMRGETLAEFQKTRRAPGALYSVTASDATLGDAPVLRVISSMATRDLLAELATAWTAQSGTPVVLESVGGVDAARRIAAGESFDVVVLAADAIDRLEIGGHVKADNRVDVAQVDVAIAVRLGAHRPAVATEAGLRAALLEATRIAVSTGPSGDAVRRLIMRWGIDDALRGRMVVAPVGVPVAALLAQGEAELGFQQRSELLNATGIDVIGAMPPGTEIVTTFCAACCSASGDEADARRMLEFLASPESAEAKRRHGMSPCVR